MGCHGHVEKEVTGHADLVMRQPQGQVSAQALERGQLSSGAVQRRRNMI